jgi:hypothetical protein
MVKIRYLVQTDHYFLLWISFFPNRACKITSTVTFLDFKLNFCDSLQSKLPQTYSNKSRHYVSISKNSALKVWNFSVREPPDFSYTSNRRGRFTMFRSLNPAVWAHWSYTKKKIAWLLHSLPPAAPQGLSLFIGDLQAPCSRTFPSGSTSSCRRVPKQFLV